MDPINGLSRAALAQVQRDLDAVRLSSYQMQLVLNGGTDGFGRPLVSAALPGGSSYGTDVLEVDGAQKEADLLCTVAQLVQDTLAEVEHVFFPTCAEHQDRLAVPRILSSESPAIWWCDGGAGHPLAAIGF